MIYPNVPSPESWKKNRENSEKKQIFLNISTPNTTHLSQILDI